MHYRYTIITLLVNMISLPTSWATDSLAALELLLDQGKYPQAWQEAKRLKQTHEGEARFDYLYGVTALETGNYDHAVFALDRAVINAPTVIRPRLELARTYLKLANDQAATKELHEVLRLNPPAVVRNKVNIQLQALGKQGKPASQSVLDGLLSSSVGYDNNANFGADEPLITTPVFGLVTLDDASVKRSSAFTELRGQLNYHYIPAEQQTWFATGKLGHKHYPEARSANTTDVELQTGVLFTQGQQHYQIAARSQQIRLDNQPYSRTLALETGITHDLKNSHAVGVIFSIEQFDHQQQNLQDNQRLQFTTQYRLASGNTTHQLEAFAGHEKPEHADGKHLSRNIVGLAYTAKQAWANGQLSSFSINAQTRKHQTNDPVYGEKRNDQRLNLQAGHQIRLTKHTSTFGQAGYIYNNSNLGLYDTQKGYIKLGINYHF